MSLRHITEIEMGSHIVKIFQAPDETRIFLALDRQEGIQRIRGPFLSEFDVRRLWEMICEYGTPRALDRMRRARREIVEEFGKRELSSISVAPVDAPREVEIPAKPTTPPTTEVPIHARTEIEQAIRRIQPKYERKPATITVLPTMPECRYVHTCPRCGSHIQSTLAFGCAGTIRLCPVCQHVHAATQ